MAKIRSRRKQGFTLLGFLFALIIGLFFAVIIIRLAPMYLEYHAVVQAMNNLVKDPIAKTLSQTAIRSRIMNSLYISYSTKTVKREHITVSKNRGIQVRVAYEVRKPMMGNIDVVGKFDKSVTLK